MSAIERTRYRRSLGSNALAFNEPRRDPQSASSTDFSSDDSIFDFAPFAASQRTSIGGATRDQSATQAPSNQPAARQILLK
jgi:hypothetical protein